MEQHNEVSKMSQLLPTTESLLREIKNLSKMTWADLYEEMDRGFNNRYKDKNQSHSGKIWVSSAGELRKLGNGHSFLSEGPLREIADWALSKNWGGVIAEEVSRYIPHVPLELIEDEKSRRNRTYQKNKLLAEGFGRVSQMAKHESRRAAVELESSLRKLTPAGYSYADILYMVHSWLVLNPPNSDRGAKQTKILHIVEPEVPAFFELVFPNTLPDTLSLPEHRNGDPYSIKCEVSSILSGIEYLAGDA